MLPAFAQPGRKHGGDVGALLGHQLAQHAQHRLGHKASAVVGQPGTAEATARANSCAVRCRLFQAGDVAPAGGGH